MKCIYSILYFPLISYLFFHKVYINDTEYSLEEIRAKKYNIEKYVNTEHAENVELQQNYSNINETLAQCSALETLANCALDPEQDHLGQLMPLTIPTLQNITKVTNMHSPGEPKVLVNLDSNEVSELVTKKNDENPRSSITDKENINQYAHSSSYGTENAGANYGKNNLLEEFNRSLMSNFLGDSVTVNTKEARWELRNIFNDNGKDKYINILLEKSAICQNFIGAVIIFKPNDVLNLSLYTCCYHNDKFYLENEFITISFYLI